MSETTSVTASGLSKHFGEFRAVDDLSFELPRGGVTGFVGPNGSGKSTTIRDVGPCVAGLDDERTERLANLGTVAVGGVAIPEIMTPAGR